MKLHRSLSCLALAVLLAGSAQAQQKFPTPEAAVEAFQAVTAKNDESLLPELFGPLAPQLMATDDADDRKETLRLLTLLFEERWALAPRQDGSKILRLGMEGWPFPVPLTSTDNSWSFNAEAGLEEIANRRVGENELIAMETCYRLVDAQEEYRLKDPNDDGVREFTSLLRSAPGAQNGLYWDTEEGEDASPLENALEDAWKYAEDRAEGTPWFGYRFKFLKSQGSKAPGGAYDYSIRGHQVAGWAVVAYPAEYGETGIMTLLCNQNGVVYEKDLGEKTVAEAEAMKRFDPDLTWRITTERL